MQTEINLIGAIASITGLSLRDVFKFLNDKKMSRMLSNQIINYIALLNSDNKDDQLSGFWTLREWNYTSQTHSNRHVTGSLAVLHYDKIDKKWHCRMCLQYRKHSLNFGPFSGNGWLAHKLGKCFTEIYQVELWKKENQEKLAGNSSEISSYPSYIATRSGIFSNITISSNGELKGNFSNSGQESSGKAKFVFHQRCRWDSFLIEDRTPF